MRTGRRVVDRCSACSADVGGPCLRLWRPKQSRVSDAGPRHVDASPGSSETPALETPQKQGPGAPWTVAGVESGPMALPRLRRDLPVGLRQSYFHPLPFLLPHHDGTHGTICHPIPCRSIRFAVIGWRVRRMNSHRRRTKLRSRPEAQQQKLDVLASMPHERALIGQPA